MALQMQLPSNSGLRNLFQACRAQAPTQPSHLHYVPDSRLRVLIPWRNCRVRAPHPPEAPCKSQTSPTRARRQIQPFQNCKHGTPNSAHRFADALNACTPSSTGPPLPSCSPAPADSLSMGDPMAASTAVGSSSPRGRASGVGSSEAMMQPAGCRQKDRNSEP